jgi:magnesium chelatase family protein
LIGAMNPCPCGYLGSTQRACRCTPDQVARYQGKLSGPLLDRIDLHVDVPAVPATDLLQAQSGEVPQRGRRAPGLVSPQHAPTTLKVARTIADLAGTHSTQLVHVAEAMQYRRANGPAGLP